MSKSATSVGGNRLLAAAWAACVLLGSLWLGVLVSRGLRLETSILAMLPASEQDPALYELTTQRSGRAARTMVFLVGHADRERMTTATRFVEAELRSSAEFTSITGAIDAEQERAFFDLYFPHRYEMLAGDLRAELEGGAGPKELLDRVRRKLSGPTSSLYTGMLERDPLLLHSAMLESWAQQGTGLRTDDGHVMLEDGALTWTLITGETAGDPFAANAPPDALAWLEPLRARVAERFDGAQLLYTGIARFAAHTRNAMKHDFTVIGLGSLIATALCIFAVFRSVRPFLLSFLPIVTGTIAATLVCLLAFERVHFLTLVFGTSLTGLGVDYALHYFAAHRVAGAEWDARRAMRDILPGITIGVFTSVLGFSGLWFTPFPVLKQFALFSSVGLVAAWATVVLWFPLFMRAPHRAQSAPWLHRVGQSFLDRWMIWRGRTSMRVLLGALCVAAVVGVPLLEFEDDIRGLQAAPRELLAEDRRVRDIAGRTEDSRFVLVEGSTPEVTLQRVEEASAVVHAAIDAHYLERCRDLSSFLPSAARQAQDKALLAKSLLPRFDELKAGLDEIGFDASVAEALRRDIESPLVTPLDPDTWLASPASQFLRPLWLGPTARGFGAVVLLGGVRDGPALEKLLGARAGIRYVDRVRDMSLLLGKYRADTLRLVLIAYAGVLLALMVRFGWRDGVLVMLPSLLSFGLTLGVLSLCGVELNLFHLLGLLLVLGLAVDYGVIFAERGTSEATALFAVTLSVLTTVAAFGLMVTSSAPPLRALSESVSIGIVLALLFSPLACITRGTRPARASSS